MSNRDILKNGLKNLGISVDDKMLNDFNIYREILVDWNQKMNLTGIEDEKEVYIKHFLDSVSAVTNGYIKDGVSIIDVGTGAGFPGLPLRICLRNIELTLLDSFVKVGGYFVCLKGPNANLELEESKAAMDVLGVEFIEKINIELPESDLNHNILVFKKVKNTPDKYPRKAGKPAKSPIK